MISPIKYQYRAPARFVGAAATIVVVGCLMLAAFYVPAFLMGL